MSFNVRRNLGREPLGSELGRDRAPNDESNNTNKPSWRRTDYIQQMRERETYTLIMYWSKYSYIQSAYTNMKRARDSATCYYRAGRGAARSTDDLSYT